MNITRRMTAYGKEYYNWIKYNVATGGCIIDGVNKKKKLLFSDIEETESEGPISSQNVAAYKKLILTIYQNNLTVRFSLGNHTYYVDGWDIQSEPVFPWAWLECGGSLPTPDLVRTEFIKTLNEYSRDSQDIYYRIYNNFSTIEDASLHQYRIHPKFRCYLTTRDIQIPAGVEIIDSNPNSTNIEEPREVRPEYIINDKFSDTVIVDEDYVYYTAPDIPDEKTWGDLRTYKGQQLFLYMVNYFGCVDYTWTPYDDPDGPQQIISGRVREVQRVPIYVPLDYPDSREGAFYIERGDLDVYSVIGFTSHDIDALPGDLMLDYNVLTDKAKYENPVNEDGALVWYQRRRMNKLHAWNVFQLEDRPNSFMYNRWGRDGRDDARFNRWFKIQLRNYGQPIRVNVNFNGKAYPLLNFLYPKDSAEADLLNRELLFRFKPEPIEMPADIMRNELLPVSMNDNRIAVIENHLFALDGQYDIPSSSYEWGPGESTEYYGELLNAYEGCVLKFELERDNVAAISYLVVSVKSNTANDRENLYIPTDICVKQVFSDDRNAYQQVQGNYYYSMVPCSYVKPFWHWEDRPIPPVGTFKFDCAVYGENGNGYDIFLPEDGGRTIEKQRYNRRVIVDGLDSTLSTPFIAHVDGMEHFGTRGQDNYASLYRYRFYYEDMYLDETIMTTDRDRTQCGNIHFLPIDPDYAGAAQLMGEPTGDNLTKLTRDGKGNTFVAYRCRGLEDRVSISYRIERIGGFDLYINDSLQSGVRLNTGDIITFTFDMSFDAGVDVYYQFGQLFDTDEAYNFTIQEIGGDNREPNNLTYSISK